MYGYQALADALVTERTDSLFTVAADDNMLLLNELLQGKKVRIISARRESGATGMADGYARATGRPGICSITVGPGLANAANSLLTASRRRSSLVCITTEPPVFKASPKLLEQKRFTEATEARYCRVRHLETLALDVQAAFRYARSEGPVVLSLPYEVMMGELEYEWQYLASDLVLAQPQRIQPDPEPLAQAASLLHNAVCPAIVVGRGAFQSGADEEITRLAEHTGAIIAHTLLAKGYLAGHPYHVGMAGAFASELGHELLSQSDCVLAVGCSLNGYTTETGLLFQEAQIVHIDRDQAQIGKTTPIALGIVGDAKATLAALNRELSDRGNKTGFWTSDVRSKIAVHRQLAQRDDELPGTIHPRQLVIGLESILPKDRIIVLDAGFCFAWATDLSVTGPSHFFPTLDFGSVGMGLYHSIGAAVGRPEQPVVLMAGDGGFMMTLEELDTAVRAKVPMVVVIMNDGGFGAEVHFLRAMHKPTDVALFENPEFAEVASALGAEGYTVRSVDDLQAIAPRLQAPGGVVVVDAKIDPNAVHEVWRDMLMQYEGTNEE